MTMGHFKQMLLTKGKNSIVHLEFEKCVSYSRMLSNQVYSSKFRLGMKRGQLARNFADKYCQKNVSQEIFLLAVQKDRESGGKKEAGQVSLGN